MVVFSKNEDCPCGSGKRYEDCCYKKEDRLFHNENEMAALIAKNLRKSRINTCLYPECKNKGIGAHALQKNGVLSKLAVNNYVYIQNPNKKPEMLEVEKDRKEPFYFLEQTLIKNATVQTCFCKEHDDKVFADIEKVGRGFSPNNLKQLFLFAYRTFSFEYYTEIASKKFQESMFKDVPQLTKENLVGISYKESLKKKKEMDYYKDFFDDALKNEVYSELSTLVIKIPYEIKFANYMCIAPDFDLKGNKINVFDKKTKMMRRVFITSFSKDSQSYILISVLKKDLHIYDKYLKSFSEVSDEVIKLYFNALIPLASQNLIVSPLLWEEWDKMGQAFIQSAVSTVEIAPLLVGLRFLLQNIHISKDKNFIFNNMKYNIFGKDNVEAKLQVINNYKE